MKEADKKGGVLGDLTTDEIMQCNFAQAKEDKFKILFSFDGTKDTLMKAVAWKYHGPESRELRATGSCTLHKPVKLQNGESKATELMHPNQTTGHKSLSSN